MCVCMCASLSRQCGSGDAVKSTLNQALTFLTNQSIVCVCPREAKELSLSQPTDSMYLLPGGHTGDAAGTSEITGI